VAVRIRIVGVVERYEIVGFTMRENCRHERIACASGALGTGFAAALRAIALTGFGAAAGGAAGGVGLVFIPSPLANDTISGYNAQHSVKVDNLPTDGDYPFQPAKQKSGEIKYGRQGGPIDKYGNEWKWDPIKGEYDVQNPNGKHSNINPDGMVTHGGEDNMPQQPKAEQKPPTKPSS
jgi:hypothetical protein